MRTSSSRRSQSAEDMVVFAYMFNTLNEHRLFAESISNTARKVPDHGKSEKSYSKALYRTQSGTCSRRFRAGCLHGQG